MPVLTVLEEEVLHLAPDPLFQVSFLDLEYLLSLLQGISRLNLGLKLPAQLVLVGFQELQSFLLF